MSFANLGSVCGNGFMVNVLEKSKPFSDILGGENAFYNQSDYLESTKKDFDSSGALPTTYRWDTEHKIIRIAKSIFSVIIFPIGIYQLIHRMVGRLVLSDIYASPESLRKKIDLTGDWRYKRITIEVDGATIDAVIMGKPETLNNGRWIIHSTGNIGLYEYQLSAKNLFKSVADALESNMLVFNYPGRGASSGMPDRQALAKAYLAMLNFLEDKEIGVGAKEIIGYGISIGGGVQGDALESHTLKDGIKYVFVKDRTFSQLEDVISSMFGKVVGFLAKLFNWNISSKASSKDLQTHEIIMQTADVETYEDLVDSSKILDDGVIDAKASLGKALLDNSACPKDKKVFIGIPEGHSSAIKNPSYLVDKIKACLAG